MKWLIDGEEVKKSSRPHSTCCACNCVVDLIKELRAKVRKNERIQDNQKDDG